MSENRPLFDDEPEIDEIADPDEVPVRDRRVYTQPYDLVVESLVEQISSGTIFLRPLSERPDFQRRYVWSPKLASRLIESILLNVPIPPCYLSQNEDYELDVIDGQQRLFSIYRFLDNQFALSNLEVLKEINEKRFHEIPQKMQRQLRTHTLRCVLITNESHPEIKFDVFERLNSNTVPLNPQELRNCIYRGELNSLLRIAVDYKPWLDILGKPKADVRMRDEELALRFFAFLVHGIDSYRTPQKHWLNDAAKEGQKYSAIQIQALKVKWEHSINTSLSWFDSKECFRRDPTSRTKVLNRALFDLIMLQASKLAPDVALLHRDLFRERFSALLKNDEFKDLISRAVDHTKRTKRRFEMWRLAMEDVFP
jgi:hypothetical protein